MNYTLRRKTQSASHITKIWRKAAAEKSSVVQEEEPCIPDWASQLEQVEAEIEAMQHTGILRPKWACGMTNQEVLAIAKHEGLNPFKYDWWDGIDPLVISEARRGGFRRGVTHTLTELRAKRAQLRREIA